MTTHTRTQARIYAHANIHTHAHTCTCERTHAPLFLSLSLSLNLENGCGSWNCALAFLTDQKQKGSFGFAAKTTWIGIETLKYPNTKFRHICM